MKAATIGQMSYLNCALLILNLAVGVIYIRFFK